MIGRGNGPGGCREDQWCSVERGERLPSSYEARACVYNPRSEMLRMQLSIIELHG